MTLPANIHYCLHEKLNECMILMKKTKTGMGIKSHFNIGSNLILYINFCELRYSLEFQLTQDGHINPFKNKEEIKNFCDQFCQKMIDGIQEGKVLSSFLVYLPIITRKKWWWFLFYKSCQLESVLSRWSLKSWMGAKTFIFLYNLLTLSKRNPSIPNTI